MNDDEAQASCDLVPFEQEEICSTADETTPGGSALVSRLLRSDLSVRVPIIKLDIGICRYRFGTAEDATEVVSEVY